MIDLDTTQMRYPNAASYFRGQYWAILPEKLTQMGAVLAMRMRGVTFTADEMNARIGMIGHPGARSAQPVSTGAIAIIPLCGVIDQKVSMMMRISGGTAVNEFMDNFRMALNDKSVSAIVFDVDSPGGSVSGIQEAADEIYRSRGKKPIIAVADPMIASAAYWLACAANEIVCMPSGMVGSIGVITVHDDWSEYNSELGYKPTYITYGQYKSEGNSDEPLPDDAKEYIQGQLDTYGNAFTAFVAKARKVPVDTVRSDFGQGRMLLAKDALAVKMIDSIGTMDTTIARLAKPTAIKSIGALEEATLAIGAIDDPVTIGTTDGPQAESNIAPVAEVMASETPAIEIPKTESPKIEGPTAGELAVASFEVIHTRILSVHT